MKKLPRTVVVLGLVSFFSDLSSEMIYPLLPLFLTTVLGASALALGLVEGVAESAAALLKLASGYLSDRVGKKKPFILTGYGLAGLVRPLIGLAGAWPTVLVLRFMDRIGKGLRTSPRDALIADVTDHDQRGTAYGFHRAMDHAGSVVGPLVAAALLYWAGFPLPWVFFAAAVPAVIVVVLILAGVHDTRPVPSQARIPPKLRGQWRKLGGTFHGYLLVVGIFTLGNATDAFFLLALSQSGLLAQEVAVLWAAHHVVKMATVFISGKYSDKLGRSRFILTGWSMHVLAYLAFAFVESSLAMVAVFVAYAVSSGLTEPVEKALVADMAPSEMRGTAFGFFHLIVGLTALPASALFGFVWYGFGSSAAFLLDAAIASVAVLGFLRLTAAKGRNPGL